ncbi:MAG: RrF2 family transcriptional regulator [Bacillota bacterium]|jgi:Rrf2 family cysteine metabolism transcriptional repressor
MNISTKGRYGLRAILDLAENYRDKPIAISAISMRQNISEGYLEQLMIPMRKYGLVKSIRGAKGGYILARDPKDILVGEVFRALEGPLHIASCASEISLESCAREEDCASKKLWHDLQKAINGVLNSYTLSDLLKNDN